MILKSSDQLKVRKDLQLDRWQEMSGCAQALSSTITPHVTLLPLILDSSQYT
jgi:hypothetical protein